MTQQRVAIAMRCHQQGRFLREAVESVEAQTVRPELLVVVNDGSTDETAQVLEELSGGSRPGLVVLERAPARGAIASLNDAIAAAIAAGADLVCPLDADDRLSPRFVELTADALQRDRGAGLSYGAVRMFGADTGVSPPQPFDLDRLMVANAVPITAMFRSSLYETIGPFDPRFEDVGFEDWEYWVRAAAHGTTGIPIDECWLEYRRYDEASRNSIGLKRSLQARGRIWRKHWRHLRPRHVSRFVGSVVRRRMTGGWD